MAIALSPVDEVREELKRSFTIHVIICDGQWSFDPFRNETHLVKSSQSMLMERPESN